MQKNTGLGRRRGTANARMPFQILWMRRMRVLRRMLRKYREQQKIDRHLYQELYQRAKGNQFKNKKVLMEVIHTRKADQQREQALKEMAEFKIKRAADRRARKGIRIGVDLEEKEEEA